MLHACYSFLFARDAFYYIVGNSLKLFQFCLFRHPLDKHVTCGMSVMSSTVVRCVISASRRDRFDIMRAANGSQT
jgi:hypothetical protein